MRATVLDPFGVEVRDLRFDAPTAGEVAYLRALLAGHGVLVMPGRDDVDDLALVAFLNRFGKLTFTVGETPVPGFPELNVVSNVGRSAPPRSTFHVDTSYVRVPPVYTALRAVEIPQRGGETLFTDQYLAYDTLPPEFRASLAGRTIRHVATGVDLGPDDEHEAEHPILRCHPISGRTSLYLSTPQRCRSISGMDEAESTAMIDLLFAHSVGTSHVLRHCWSPGDVVMWDNGCVLHRGDHHDVVGARVMHRGMVAGPYDVSPAQ